MIQSSDKMCDNDLEDIVVYINWRNNCAFTTYAVPNTFKGGEEEQLAFEWKWMPPSLSTMKLSMYCMMLCLHIPQWLSMASHENRNMAFIHGSYLHISLPHHQNGHSCWKLSEVGHCCRLVVGSHYQYTVHHPALSVHLPGQSRHWAVPHQLENKRSILLQNW